MLTRVIRNGADVMRLELEEYTLHSPPIPTDRRAYLNGEVKETRAQKFQHTRLPDKKTYLAWDRARQQKLEDEEWDRRLNGAWFFNCGEPTYLTGKHYYYLNYHRYKKNVKPEYRQANLEFYWVWQYCQESENCYGLYLHTRRRDGKTSRSASIGTEAATRIPSFRFGIASKTDTSARESVFKSEVIRPLKALRACPWFMPKVVGKLDPENNLEFGSRSTSAQAAQLEETEVDDIASWIGWFLPTPNAADSDDLDFFLNDEVAKKQAHDSYQRWMTVKPQFVPNGIVKGKAICATTTDQAKESNPEDGEARVVDKADGTAVKQARKFWRNSDHTKLAPSESTESGLFRLFVPAYKGFKVDEYGRDTPEGRADFERRRAKLTGVALINQERENPFTIDEALQEEVNENCEFNATHILHNLKAIDAYELVTGKPLTRRYRLEWSNAATWEGPVRAVPDEQGDWQFAWLPDAKDLNQVLPLGFVTDKAGRRWRKYKPLAVDDTSLGIDPVLRKKSQLNHAQRASQYAISVKRPWNGRVERLRGQPTYWPTESFIGRYNARPENPNVCNEELCKGMHLLGCEASIERQTADAAIEFVEEHGYGEFLADKPLILESDTNKNQNGPGVNASTFNTGRMVAQFGQFVTDFMGSAETENSRGEVGVNDQGIPYDFRRNPFKECLRDNHDFDASDTKKSDDTMAQLYAHNHSRRYDRRTYDDQGAGDEQGVDAEVFNPSQYFR